MVYQIRISSVHGTLKTETSWHFEKVCENVKALRNALGAFMVLSETLLNSMANPLTSTMYADY